MANSKQIVIIGGGITGLSAAWYLNIHSNQSFNVILIEVEKTLGGKIVTRQVEMDDGKQLVVDGGVDSFTMRKPQVWVMAEELSMQDEVISGRSELDQLLMLRDGKPVRIPKSFLGLLFSGLLTFKGKLRIIKELFISAKADEEDESVASFFTRRFGREFLDKVAGPVLMGSGYGDREIESMLAVHPELVALEKEYGSLLEVVLRWRLANLFSSGSRRKNLERSTFKQGAQALIHQLADKLEIEIRTDIRALEVNKYEGQFQVVLSVGDPILADGVILATPAKVSSEILKYAAPESAALLFQIQQEPRGSVLLAYRSAEAEKPKEIQKLLIPRSEKRKIDAVEWMTGKPNKEPSNGYDLVKVHFGNADGCLVELSDAELVSTIQGELKDIVRIKAEPVHTEVFRWQNGFPRLDVGHLELVDLIEGQLPEGLFLAGSSYRGSDVPDCIQQGYDAAELCLQHVEGAV